MDALYQVKSRRAETDLSIDQLRETLRLLAGEKVPGVSKLEKRLEEVSRAQQSIALFKNFKSTCR